MAFSLERMFTSALSAPPQANGIAEIPPCAPLAPYVRCFWAGDGRAGVRVIPDICADIIVPLDGSAPAFFCGTSARSFVTKGSAPLFGIRFFAWAVPLFAHADASLFFGRSVPACDVFPGFGRVQERIRETRPLSARIAAAQQYLLSLLGSQELDSAVMNALHFFIAQNCRTSVVSAARSCAASTRSLERKFLRTVGTSPVQTLGLVRYQLLWQECLKPGFDPLDCVEKFGFYDQAHLCNRFKAHHGIPLAQARAEHFALSHFSNTAGKKSRILALKDSLGGEKHD